MVTFARRFLWRITGTGTPQRVFTVDGSTAADAHQPAHRARLSDRRAMGSDAPKRQAGQCQHSRQYRASGVPTRHDCTTEPGEQEAYRVRLFHQFSRLRSAAIRLDVWPAPLVGGFGFAVEIGFAIAIGLGVQSLSTGQTTSNNILLFAILALPVYRQLYEVGLAFLLLRFADQALQRTRALLASTHGPASDTPAAWALRHHIRRG